MEFHFDSANDVEISWNILNFVYILLWKIVYVGFQQNQRRMIFFFL